MDPSSRRSLKTKECSRCKVLRKELRKSYERIKLLEARLKEIELVCRLPFTDNDSSSSSSESDHEIVDSCNRVHVQVPRNASNKSQQLKRVRRETTNNTISVEVDPLNGISQSIEENDNQQNSMQDGIIVHDVCSEGAAADSLNSWDFVNSRETDQLSDSFVNHFGDGSTTKADNLQYPTPLPALSHRLVDAEQMGTLLKEYNLFVREVGKFLCELVEEPTPSDFHNFARTIVERYPVFADHHRKFPWDNMKDRLRRWYMNKKYYSQNREETRARRALRAAIKRGAKRHPIDNGESGSEAN